MLDMYRNLAKGKVGLIITGYVGFSKTDYHNRGTVVLSEDSSLTGLKELTRTVHQHGSKVVAQINHAGSQLMSPPNGAVYGPSEVADPFSGITPISFTENQIRDLVTEFGDAAVLAKKSRV